MINYIVDPPRYTFVLINNECYIQNNNTIVEKMDALECLQHIM